MTWTEEQKRWLVDHIDKADSYSHLSELFNETFGANRSVSQVKDKCNKGLNIRNGKGGGRFSHDSKPRELPIGTIRKSQTATFIKVCDTERDISGYQRPNWIPLQQKIYEDAHGKIPDGHMVCFLDNNPENFALENLRSITRQTACRLAQNKWWSTDPNITLAAILLCELNAELKGV